MDNYIKLKTVKTYFKYLLVGNTQQELISNSLEDIQKNLPRQPNKLTKLLSLKIDKDNQSNRENRTNIPSNSSIFTQNMSFSKYLSQAILNDGDAKKFLESSSKRIGSYIFASDNDPENKELCNNENGNLIFKDTNTFQEITTQICKFGLSSVDYSNLNTSTKLETKKEKGKILNE